MAWDPLESGKPVNKEDARAKFQEADRLYQQAHYEGALQLLNELEHEFPRERRVLYPKARCLTKLRRYDEAHVLAESLAREHEYKPARALMEHIEQHLEASAQTENFDRLPSGLESILDAPASFQAAGAPPVPQSANAPDWVKPAVVAGVVLVILIGGSFGQARWGGAFDAWMTETSEEAGLSEAPPVGGLVFMFLFYTGTALVASCLGGYLGLAVVKRLPYDDFWSNMKDILLYVIYCLLLALVPLVGWVFIPYILYKHYETSFWDLLVMAVVYTVVSWVAQLGFVFVVGLGSLAFA